jgi:hypothetical protein
MNTCDKTYTLRMNFLSNLEAWAARLGNSLNTESLAAEFRMMISNAYPNGSITAEQIRYLTVSTNRTAQNTNSNLENARHQFKAHLRTEEIKVYSNAGSSYYRTEVIKYIKQKIYWQTLEKVLGQMTPQSLVSPIVKITAALALPLIILSGPLFTLNKGGAQPDNN